MKSLPKNQGLYLPEFEHDSCGVGFVCDIKGKKSNKILKQGLEVLRRLAHRGAVGADPETGDGAGILIQLPHEFFKKNVPFKLFPDGSYGTGIIFLPRDKRSRSIIKDVLGKIVEESGQKLLGWREIPVDSRSIGKAARASQPAIEQIFIGKGARVNNQLEFEKILYLIRRQAEQDIQSDEFYITSLSSRIIIYKGLLKPDQVENFYLDLKSRKLKTAIALVHSRYSTNTFPAWELAQPFRFLAHNGEINTLRGNLNWLKARGLDITNEAGSDSACLDNVFEHLVLSGKSLPHAMMMLIPEAWENNNLIDKKLKDFYRCHACQMEPWDGPAAVAFTDGRSIGAVLDRNGLRPARYIVTKGNLVVMASEVGVLNIPESDILLSKRLEPGKIFFIDTLAGRIIENEEIKNSLADGAPYAKMLEEQLVDLENIKSVAASEAEEKTDLNTFNYTREDLRYILKPMAETGIEPVGSMGNDTPLAVLSEKPQLLYNYFKQLFAQVTNPPIDPIREEIVMSIESYVGGEKKLLVREPVISSQEFNRIKSIAQNVIPIRLEPGQPLEKSLDQICSNVEKSAASGFNLIILSDRGVQNPIPALLACGAVHHHLIKKGLRSKTGLIIDSGEPRETHHFALLLGYGADLIFPYLAYRIISDLAINGEITLDASTAISNYRHAAHHGLKKILSKMGISTLLSYRGAQIFEALGIGQAVIDKCFAGTVSRIGGIGFAEIETSIKNNCPLLDDGIYQWKKNGEFHVWDPETITALQQAARENDPEKYRRFAGLINQAPATLRSQLKIKGAKPIPLEKVEPAEEILKRFSAGAMSFGSISRPMHETIAEAMNLIGGRSNTGEGGEDPARFNTPKHSKIKQIASGRFGVTCDYLSNAEEIQIKIAQGAKPGEGGQLPGHKVSAMIAKTRCTTPGVTLISPPPHHDIYSIEDLAQLIFDLKNVNPRARISVKLVSEIGVGTVAAGVAKGGADMILISGGDGGTGASPKSSIRHAGLPWELGLAETNQTLVLNNLRGRVRLQADGGMRTGRDLAVAAMLGADEFGFATALLIVSGCVMLRHCHLNICAVGVATQDEFLSKRFSGKAEYIVNYLKFVAEELREIMAACGIARVDDLVGRVDFLENCGNRVDLSKILYKPQTAEKGEIHEFPQDHEKMEIQTEPDLAKLPVKRRFKISNTDRAVGARLSGLICKKFGAAGLPDDSIHYKFQGIAGQSFAAWLVRGVTFELEGMANDYVGKGFSGGKLIIYPYKKSWFAPHKNVVVGNTCFYGAISGEAYIRGEAGERFCVRNSGLCAVVEGVGDHGCEYMTGGRVIILGETGRNFAAGMSGGTAYVYDRLLDFKDKVNLSMVVLEELKEDDRTIIREMVYKHQKYTGSRIAAKILDNFESESRRFVKVMPKEYRRILEEQKYAIEEISDG